MTTYGATYEVFRPNRARVAHLSVLELERVGRGEATIAGIKRGKKRPEVHASMRATAQEATSRRNPNLLVRVACAALGIAGLGMGGLIAIPRIITHSAPESTAPSAASTSSSTSETLKPATHAHPRSFKKAEAVPSVTQKEILGAKKTGTAKMPVGASDTKTVVGTPALGVPRGSIATPYGVISSAPGNLSRINDDKGDYTQGPKEVSAAQSILRAPMTAAEVHIKPFFDRIVNDAGLSSLVYAVSATTNTPLPRLMQIIAAETGGRPGNPLQVTHPQFPQLLGGYGSSYANMMENYASKLDGDKGNLIRAQAAELRFISGFVKNKTVQVPGTHGHPVATKVLNGFEFRNDLYQRQVKPNPRERSSTLTLQQRADALYKDDYIRTGLQTLSNDADLAKIPALLGDRDPRKVFGTDALPRLTNYFGLSRLVLLSKMHNPDKRPVAGTLMDLETAKANHVDYHYMTKKQDVTIKIDGQLKHVIRTTQVPVTKEADVIIKVHGRVKQIKQQVKVPVTIGELEKTQLEIWNGSEEAIRTQLARHRAQRVVKLPSPQAPS